MTKATDSKKTSETVVAYYKHPLAIRWTHWINFPILTLMIVSGTMIYWANQAYTPFIPNSFFEKLGLDQLLAYGLGLHFFFMWIFAINGFVYALYLLISGEWREVLPKLSSFKDALLVTLYDLKLRKKLPPQGKFNGGQKIAYFSITLLGFFQLLTGLAIYKPVQLQPLMMLFGGYEGARLLHFIFTVLFVLFFMVHVFQVLRAGWNNFRSMVTGIEEITEDDIQQAQGLSKRFDEGLQ